MSAAQLLALLLLVAPMSPAQTIASLVDRYRVLLVFAPAAQDPQLQQQLKSFDHREADLRDRDLLIIPIIAQPGQPVTSNTLRLLNPPAVSAQEQLTLRSRFRVARNDFTTILLGKDGGEKLRSSLPIAADRIDQTIDAMPMRQQEMKRRNPPGTLNRRPPCEEGCAARRAIPGPDDFHKSPLDSTPAFP